MTAGLDDAVGRARGVLVLFLAAALSAVVPTMTATLPSAGVAAVALVALALAAVVGLGARSAALAACSKGMAPPVDVETPPMRTGSVTDPIHHPLRPRAPGRD